MTERIAGMTERIAWVTKRRVEITKRRVGQQPTVTRYFLTTITFCPCLLWRLGVLASWRLGVKSLAKNALPVARQCKHPLEIRERFPSYPPNFSLVERASCPLPDPPNPKPTSENDLHITLAYANAPMLRSSLWHLPACRARQENLSGAQTPFRECRSPRRLRRFQARATLQAKSFLRRKLF